MFNQNLFGILPSGSNPGEEAKLAKLLAADASWAAHLLTD
jgi:hypothetical protein